MSHPLNVLEARSEFSTSGGAQPRWRMDGKEIFYRQRWNIDGSRNESSKEFGPGRSYLTPRNSRSPRSRLDVRRIR